MDRIKISMKKFNRMRPIKQGIVHYKNDKIYKHSPRTFDIVNAIDTLQDQEVFKYISVPTAYLYYKKKYFGYVMNYYKKLKQVEEAIKKGIIKDIEKYSLELLSIIEELNKLHLCYWDFHEENILSDEKGHPFILDIDDMEYLPSHEDLHNQREYLAEFLLCIYLNKRKSIHSFARETIIKQTFKDKTLMYIDSLGDLKEPVPELPYCIIEELQDIEKRELIKSNIK